MILVDYRCSSCSLRAEHAVASAAPELPCPACGAASRRLFSAPHLLGRGTAPTAPAAAVEAPLCRTNPWVPGLCHVAPAAAKGYVARARGDNRTLDAELERQETAFRESPETVPDPVVAHGHSHGHTHGDAAVGSQGHSHTH